LELLEKIFRKNLDEVRKKCQLLILSKESNPFNNHILQTNTIMIKKFLALPFAAVLLSGCAVVDHLQTEEVVIDSKPQGAAVYIGGELKGKTPYTVRLAKDISHNVIIRKPGYQDKAYTIGTNEVNPFIKFGPLVDAGYYYELVPNPSGGNMKPDFLPEVPGLNKFDEMMDAVVKADTLKDEGKVDTCEHAYILDSISEFYAPGVKAEIELIEPAQASEYDKMTKEVIDLENLKKNGKIDEAEYKSRMSKIVEKYNK
jgi:hypothetical protein